MLGRLSILVFLLVSLLGSNCAIDMVRGGEPLSSSAEMLADAELNDVYFLDPDRGWAVGDRGVIWQTEDGGRSWQLADSPTTACLKSVTFVDEQYGWIAGGWVHPVTHRTSAVLLRTENGGKKWTRVEVPTLPALEKVRFATSRTGWAVGSASSMYATGLFQTSDGGHTWESPWVAQSTASPNSILAGDLINIQPAGLRSRAASGHPSLRALPASFAGIVIAEDRSVWKFIEGNFEPMSQSLHATPLAVDLSATRGWLVGKQGMIMVNEPGSRDWRLPPGRLDVDHHRNFDWQTVTTRDEKVWIAGSPGTSIVHSPDGGRTWRRYQTGQTLPIRRLFFLDDQYGWAVGPLGRILATRDGGATWRLQRAGGNRVGVLAVHGSAKQLPLELLAMVAADQGHLAGAALLNDDRSDQDETVMSREARTAFREARLREACSAVGLSVASTLTDTAARRQTNDDALDAPLAIRSPASDWERLLVAHIRTWRPDVILTDNIDTSNQSSASGPQTAQLVLSAVQKSADPSMYPEQITLAHLEPWQARKVVAALNNPDGSGAAVETDRLSLLLGCSLSDFTIAARGLLDESVSMAPPRVSYRVLWSQATHEIGARDLFSGIAAANIGDSRRPNRTPPATQVDELTRAAQRLRNLREIAAHGQQGEAQITSLVPQFEQLLQGLDREAAGRALYQFAVHFMEHGHYSSAAEALRTLVERCPEHLLSDGALAWLIRYHSSAELQHAFGPRTLVRLPAPATAATVPSSVLANTSVTPATFNQPVPPVHQDSLRHALQHAELIRRTRPALYFDPRTQFPLVSVTRRCGQSAESQRLLNFLAGAPLQPHWTTISKLEKRLLEANARLPSTTATADAIAQKPVLDGLLEDICWERTNPILMPISNTGQTAAVLFCFDEEFLYIACHSFRERPNGNAPSSVRTRDAVSTDLDRMQIVFDTDRDYQTAFELTVDERGWTAEACCGDLRWNPNWYVASKSDNRSWQVEAAIPIAELSPSAMRGETWGLSIRRAHPIEPDLCWPAEELGMPQGLLMFSP